jgi:hypothetical protein
MNSRAAVGCSVGSLLAAGGLALAAEACSGGSTTGASGDGGGVGSGTGTGKQGTGTGAGGTGTGSGSGAAGDAGGFTYDGSCSPDLLKTGLVAMQTGVSVDAFDCEVLAWAAKYGEPDPMIFKAIIYVESRFDDTAVACPNDPCGTPTGWTTAESGCFGLMQVVPACDGSDAGLLPNGQPNMTTSDAAAGWAGSIFNPSINIELGISGVAGNRAQVEKQFPGCTTDQYTMMAIGNYNSYGSTKSCTEVNDAYDTPLVMAYQTYAAAARYPAHSYTP